MANQLGEGEGMAVLDKVKSFFKRREPEAKAQQAEPAKVAGERSPEVPERKTSEGHEVQGTAQH